MDVLYKAGSLLYTQVSCAARIALALPGCALRCALAAAGAGVDAQNAPAGRCVFYEGVVTHARKRPVANVFEYPMRVALLDLDDPPPWFAASGQARDHLTAAEACAFAGTDGPVLLLTNPASAGYVQNPISVYYCYPAEAASGAAASGTRQNGGGAATAEQQPGQQQQEAGGAAGGPRPPAPWAPPEGVAPVVGIAEVTNTPWGDRVRFCFDPAGDSTPKALHVSPFMDMGNEWHLKASPPGERLRLSVVVTHPALGQYFDAHLVARRCGGPGAGALNEHAGWGRLLRYGFMPQRVAFWIYWQAVVLVAKGCPIYPKPAGESFKPRVAAEAEGKLPPIGGRGGRGPGGAGVGGGSGGSGAGGGGCPFEWTDTKAWPWYL